MCTYYFTLDMLSNRTHLTHTVMLHACRFKEAVCESGVSDVTVSQKMCGTFLPVTAATATVQTISECNTGDNEWKITLSNSVAGPIRVVVTFEAVNQPSVTSDGLRMESSVHSLLILRSEDGFDVTKAVLPATLSPCDTNWLPLLCNEKCNNADACVNEAVSMMLAASAVCKSSIDASTAADDDASSVHSDDTTDSTALDTTLVKAAYSDSVDDAEAVFEQLTATASTTATAPQSLYDHTEQGHLLVALVEELLKASDHDETFAACKRFMSTHAVAMMASDQNIVSPLLHCWSNYSTIVNSSTQPMTVLDCFKHVVGERCAITATLAPVLNILDGFITSNMSEQEVWSALILAAHNEGSLVSKHAALEQLCSTLALQSDAPEWRELFVNSVNGVNSSPTKAAMQQLLQGSTTASEKELLSVVYGMAGKEESRNAATKALQSLTHAMLEASNPSHTRLSCLALVVHLLNTAQMSGIAIVMKRVTTVTARQAAVSTHSLLSYIIGRVHSMKQQPFVKLFESNRDDIIEILQRKLTSTQTAADDTLLAGVQLPSDNVLQVLVQCSMSGSVSAYVNAVHDVIEELTPAQDKFGPDWAAVQHRVNALTHLRAAIQHGDADQCLQHVTSVIELTTVRRAVAYPLSKFLRGGGMSVLLSDGSSESSSGNKLTAVLQSLKIYAECASSSTETISLHAVLSLMSNYPEAPSMSAIIQFVQIDAVCEILQ
jgi:hypothetical protein